MASPIQRAKDEGSRAALRGEPDSACPYKKGMVMQAWLQGWRITTRDKDNA
jgi:ribosome modulation factor